MQESNACSSEHSLEKLRRGEALSQNEVDILWGAALLKEIELSLRDRKRLILAGVEQWEEIRDSHQRLFNERPRTRRGSLR